MKFPKLCTNTPTNTFQSALHPSLPNPVQFIIALLDPIFETIYIYLNSHHLNVNNQFNFKEQKSGTTSLLIFKTNRLIPSNVILKFSS